MPRPGMSDGRCFTSYIANCQLNDNIQIRNNIANDAQYRRFLQENATQLMTQMGDVCFSDDTKLCNAGCADNTSLSK